MTITLSPDQRERTYGNWTRPRSPGLGKLSTLATIVVFVGLIFGALSLRVSFVVSLFVLGMTALIAAPMVIRNRHGQTLWEQVGVRMGWVAQRATKQQRYRSGPLTPIDRFALPGLGAAISVVPAQDALGQHFALLHHPNPGHVTAVFRSEPEGTNLVDQRDVDTQVGYFGALLAALGHDPDIVGISVTITSAPDWGHRLRDEVIRNMHPNAHDLALQTMEEITRTYPATASTLTCHTAVTWRRSTGGGKRRPLEEMAREVGRQLPNIAQDLSRTGAGVPTLVRAEELARYLRASYDPACASLIEQVAGNADPAITWANAGPTAADETPRSYMHDSGVSRSWIMSEAPRSEVLSSVLADLLSAHPDVARKRVTMVYRPLAPHVAAARVDRAVRDTHFRVNSSPRPAARDQLQVRAAEQAAYEEARGAGVLRFSMIVTATVLEGQDLERASTAVERAAGRARVQLRPATSQQSTAFLASLPLGLHLADHSNLPTFVRDNAR